MLPEVGSCDPSEAWTDPLYTELLSILNQFQSGDWLGWTTPGADRRKADAADANAVAMDATANSLHNGGSEDATATRTSLRIAHFEILRPLGSGGFGVVSLARDMKLGRLVALKVLRPEALFSKEVRERFLREARAAGGLDHPGIVQVHEVIDCGLACAIAYAFCEGTSLSQWLKRQSEPVAPKQGASLIADIADAVQHAHERGIVHRDIKPANILVDGERLSTCRARLSDFGLARFLDEGEQLTRSGLPIGTPPYMAPEQVAGKPDQVGPLADVYALGATLYELLTGRPPFRGETNQETFRLIAENAPVSVRSLRPGIARDLDTIVMTCLEKDPARRYRSAGALNADLRCYLRGAPITARRISAIGRMTRWARRRPVVAGLAGAISILVVAIAIGSSFAALELNKQRRELQLSEHAMAQTLYGVRMNLVQAAWESGNTSDANSLLEQTRPKPGRPDHRNFEWYYWNKHVRSALSGVALIPSGWTIVAPTLTQLSRGADRLLCLARTPQGLAKLLVLNTKDGKEVVQQDVETPDGGIKSSVMSADGRFLAVARHARSQITITIQEIVSGRIVWERKEPATGELKSTRLALSEEGARIAIATIHVQESDSNIRSELTVWDVKWNTVRIRNSASGMPPTNLNGMEFTRDGKTLAVINAEPASRNKFDGEYQIWDVERGVQLHGLRTPGFRVVRLILSPDHSSAIIFGTKRELYAEARVVSLHEGREIGKFSIQEFIPTSLSISSDGRHLLLAAEHSSTAKLLDASNGRLLREFRHGKGIACAQFGPDFGSVVTVDKTGILTRWDASEPDEYRGGTHWVSKNTRSAFLSPDGKLVGSIGASADRSPERIVSIHSADTGLPAGRSKQVRLKDPDTGLPVFSPDGRLVGAWVLDDAQPADTTHFLVWEISSGADVSTTKVARAQVGGLAAKPVFDRAGHRVALPVFATDDSDESTKATSAVELHETLTGRLIRTFPMPPGAAIRALVMSPDDQYLVASGALHTSSSTRPFLIAWHMDTARVVFQHVEDDGAGAEFTSLAVSPGGELLAASLSTNDRTTGGGIVLWDFPIGRRHQGRHQVSRGVEYVSFAPDGKRLISALRFGPNRVELRLTDATTLQDVLKLPKNLDLCDTPRMSPDGSKLFATFRNNPINDEVRVAIWKADR